MAYGLARFCLALSFVAACGLAQTPQPQRIDKAAIGVAFQIPGTWTIDNRPFVAPGDAEGLVRAGSLNGRVALQVFLFERAAVADFDQWVTGFETALRGFPGIVAIERGPAGSLARPTRALLVRAERAPDEIDTCYVCVRLDEETVVTFAWSQARVAGEAVALAVPRELEVLLSTIEIYHDADLARELPFSRRRGLKFAQETLAQQIRGLRLDRNPRTYLYEVGNSARGYREVRFRAERQSAEDPRVGNARGEPGLRVTESEWQFVGQQASYEAWDAFSSVSGKTGLYEHTLSETAQIGGVFTAPLVTRDECIRAGDQLVTSYTTSFQVALPDPRRPFPLGRDYVGLAWALVLPALVPADQSEWLTVQSYHPDSRDVVPVSIRCVGEDPIEGSDRPGRICEMRWGHRPVVRIKVDPFGNPLWWTQGQSRWTLADATEVEQRFEAQREAARPRLSNVRRPADQADD